jgi:hypothetical protein
MGFIKLYSNLESPKETKLFFILLVLSLVVSFWADLSTFPLSEGWYWGIQQFISHGVPIQEMGFQLPTLGVWLLSYISSFGFITGKLISVVVLVASFVFMSFYLFRLSASLSFSLVLSSFFFSMFMTGKTFLFGDYHVFYILGMTMLLAATVGLGYWKAPVALIGLLTIASMKQNIFLAFLPFSCFLLSHEIIKKSTDTWQFKLSRTKTKIVIVSLSFCLAAIIIFLADQINSGFYTAMVTSGEGYSSKGDLYHVFTRIYHDPNNARIIRYTLNLTFKFVFLAISSTILYLLFWKTLAKFIHLDKLCEEFALNWGVKLLLCVILFTYGALRAPINDFIVAVTISFYFILVLVAFFVLTKLLYETPDDIKIFFVRYLPGYIVLELLSATGFGLLIIALNTTTASFSFDGIGIAMLILSAIIFRLVKNTAKPFVLTLFCLILIPTMLYNAFEKFDVKYTWWDVGVEKKSTLAKFNAGTSESDDFLLPVKAIKFINEIKPDDLSDRNSIVFLPHIAGLYKILDIKPSVKIPVAWYDISSSKKNKNLFEDLSQNFPERLVLWDNAVWTITGHRGLLGNREDPLLFEVFLKTLACLASNDLISFQYHNYGTARNAQLKNQIFRMLSDAKEKNLTGLIFQLNSLYTSELVTESLISFNRKKSFDGNIAKRCWEENFSVRTEFKPSNFSTSFASLYRD